MLRGVGVRPAAAAAMARGVRYWVTAGRGCVHSWAARPDQSLAEPRQRCAP